MNFVCWISTLRNPWYSLSSSIYFSCRDTCSFVSGCSNPETPDIAPDTPDHQTRSIRAYTRSIRDNLCLTLLLSVFRLQIAYSPPSRHLKILSPPLRHWEAAPPACSAPLRCWGGSAPAPPPGGLPPTPTGARRPGSAPRPGAAARVLTARAKRERGEKGDGKREEIREKGEGKE